MKILFIFLDGVGLGSSNPEINPFARANLPVLESLLNGQKLVLDSTPYSDNRATLLALDANLGVEGIPQSATGQAVLLTGLNIPSELGYHYGPKPNPEVARYLQNGNLFSTLLKSKHNPAFLNAYPPRYFDAIHSGKRNYSSIPLAVVSAGLKLRTADELRSGLALSADFTGQGWHDHLGIKNIRVFTARQAGSKLAELAQAYDFTMFEYWLTDYAGHNQEMEPACALLQNFDGVMSGLLETWDTEHDLILITSDHGNLEDLSTRRHTTNPVPALLIGPQTARRIFIQDLKDLTGIMPSILRSLNTQHEGMHTPA